MEFQTIFTLMLIIIVVVVVVIFFLTGFGSLNQPTDELTSSIGTEEGSLTDRALDQISDYGK